MCKTPYGFSRHQLPSLCGARGRTARCEADRFQRAPCNGWRSCVEKGRVFAIIFFMTSSQLHCSSPGPLTSLGLVHILTIPCPLSLLGMAPTLFTSTDHATRRTDPFGSESSSLSLLKSTLDAQGQPHTLLAKKQAPVFIIRNICVVIPSAVIALSTGNRISPSLPCFFSAGLTGYLLLLPQ